MDSLKMLMHHKRAAAPNNIQLDNPPLHHHKKVTYVVVSRDAITHYDHSLSLGCVVCPFRYVLHNEQATTKY